jgi:hypothetical protein
MEEWRDIYGGIYSVSSDGKVRRNISRTRARAGTLLKGYMTRCGRPKRRPGYLLYVLGVNGEKIVKGAANLVALAFFGPCPEGKQVNHKNGIKLDNRVENLEYVTGSENIRHAFRTGLKRAPYGAVHFKTKLTEDDVREIRRRRKAGEMCKDIAPDYGIHVNTVAQIGRRMRWIHLA